MQFIDRTCGPVTLLWANAPCLYVVAGRGRRRKACWNVLLFVLRRANADFMPIAAESNFLSSCGLGKKVNIPGTVHYMSA